MSREQFVIVFGFLHGLYAMCVGGPTTVVGDVSKELVPNASFQVLIRGLYIEGRDIVLN